MRIIYLTAGAAGMYCGSCLHDNALCKALIGLGHDAMLVPTYTPILTDEENISSDRLFYGGLNVYLQQKLPLLGKLPKWTDSFLSSPRLVGWIAERAMGTTAGNLGALTVSMLRGEHGRQKKEVERLCHWLKEQAPDVVIFSNLLIAGCIPEIKKRIGCPCVVILQGDDIFYDSLQQPFKDQAISELRRLAKRVDRFVVHTRDYGERMQEVLQFEDRQLSINPLSIDVSDFASLDAGQREDKHPPTVGYLARLAPEKGLHILVEAFLKVQQQIPTARLSVAGWLGKQHQEYWDTQQRMLDDAGLSDHYEYWGSVDRQAKLDFLQQVNVLSVPTPYLEPKGLFVLEGLAAGIPYVQPAHGAFPEIHERLGGGHLYQPKSTDQLAERLVDLLNNPSETEAMGAAGRDRVHERATTRHEAEQFMQILEQL